MRSSRILNIRTWIWLLYLFVLILVPQASVSKSTTSLSISESHNNAPTGSTPSPSDGSRALSSSSLDSKEDDDEADEDSSYDDVDEDNVKDKHQASTTKKPYDALRDVDTDYEDDEDGDSGGDSDDDSDADDEPLFKTTKRPPHRLTRLPDHHHHVHFHTKSLVRTTPCACPKSTSAPNLLKSRSGLEGVASTTVEPSNIKFSFTSSASTSSPATNTNATTTSSKNTDTKTTKTPEDSADDSTEDYSEEGEYRTTPCPDSVLQLPVSSAPKTLKPNLLKSSPSIKAKSGLNMKLTRPPALTTKAPKISEADKEKKSLGIALITIRPIESQQLKPTKPHQKSESTGKPESSSSSSSTTAKPGKDDKITSSTTSSKPDPKSASAPEPAAAAPASSTTSAPSPTTTSAPVATDAVGTTMAPANDEATGSGTTTEKPNA